MLNWKAELFYDLIQNLNKISFNGLNNLSIKLKNKSKNVFTFNAFLLEKSFNTMV